MIEKIEKIYNSEQERREEALEAIKIPEKDWQTLEIIARRVGGDFGMKVKLGPLYLEEVNPLTGKKEKIPYVAFEDLRERIITFNPIFVIENPKEAKRIAAHEGAHRAITRGEHEIGLSKEQVRELVSENYLGFHSFRNIGLEDPRVNNWDTGRFPGLRELNKEVYDEQLQEENSQFIAPEVNLVISKLGRYPRYAEAASELLRYWHKGKYSKKLKPEIEKFLRRVQRYAREYQENIPPTDKSLEEAEVIKIARKCFKEYHDDIWPEVKKLVEMDLKTEQNRQMVKDFRKMQGELKRKQREMEEAEKREDSQKAKELQKEIEGLKQELDPFNGLPQDVKEELEREIDKAIGEAAGRLNKEIENKQKQVKDAKENIKRLDREIKDLEKKSEKASGKEKEELEKEIEKKQAEKAAQEAKQGWAEKELQDIKDALDDIQSGEEIPYPEDRLSGKTKNELEKLFDKLPDEKQDEIKDEARETMEDFEDTINKETEGKLNDDKPESHQERREREKAERQAAQKSKEAKEAKEQMEKELERIRKEKMSPYERARAEVTSLIDDLYYRLRKILKPEEFSGEELDQPRGSMTQMERIMQSERDPTQLRKAWIQETAPEKKDYRFWHLIDLSGSMAGEKIKETLKGLIVVGEAVDRIENVNSDTLEVHQGITGFSDDIYPIKGMRQQFDQEIEEKLAAISQMVGGSTNTFAGTIKAYEKLKENLGESDNYLLTFSDGEPNYNIREKLKDFLKGNFEERRKLSIKIGLIWVGEVMGEEEFKKLEKSYSDNLDDLSPEQKKEINELKSKGDFHSAAVKLLVYVYGYDFGLSMPAVNPKGKKRDFADKFSDLMEDLVRESEKY